MKKLLLVCLLLICAVVLFSAEKEETLKISLSVEEIVYAVRVIQSVEITGDEVEPFVDAKNFFLDEFKKAQEGKKKLSDKVSLKVPLSIAQNFINFTTRATIQGTEADLYYNIVNSLVKAAEKK